MILCKLTKNRGAFHSDDALVKLFYLALRKSVKNELQFSSVDMGIILLQ
jgi:hypothetical protein